jgi:hypothetical protein
MIAGGDAEHADEIEQETQHHIDGMDAGNEDGETGDMKPQKGYALDPLSQLIQQASLGGGLQNRGLFGGKRSRTDGRTP